MPEDLETSVCKRCGVDITFELDDPEADDNPFGLWYDDGREACIPGPNDEDQYHEPSEEES